LFLAFYLFDSLSHVDLSGPGFSPRLDLATNPQASFLVSVSNSIDPAYNEAQNIAATIQNKLDQDYPCNQLEIIVISDGSTDGTDDIVRGLVPRMFGSSGGNSARQSRGLK